VANKYAIIVSCKHQNGAAEQRVRADRFAQDRWFFKVVLCSALAAAQPWPFGGSHQCVLLLPSYLQQGSSKARVTLAVCCTWLLAL
jgi:hypothetical protein